MEIIRDRKVGNVYLSWKGYIEKVLNRFNILNAKSVSTLFETYFRLSAALSPESDDEVDYISWIPYSSTVDL